MNRPRREGEAFDIGSFATRWVLRMVFGLKCDFFRFLKRPLIDR